MKSSSKKQKTLVSSIKSMFYKKSKKDNTNFERCIMCGKLTGIPVDLPIDFREYYEIGLGQLCVICHNNLYHDNSLSCEISGQDMRRLFESSKKQSSKSTKPK